jgi:hypothetical protein
MSYFYILLKFCTDSEFGGFFQKGFFFSPGAFRLQKNLLPNWKTVTNYAV